MSSGLSVAVVGATGAVGQEFLRLFEARNFPVGKLTLLASERSVGKSATFAGVEHPIKVATNDSFVGVDVAFFSAGASRSRDLVPSALAAGALVVDNSSAFRTDPSVPLTVPEVNGCEVLPSNRLISVPNCCAVILALGVHPLRRLGTIERLIVSTYQSASGGGAAMMRLLEDETRAVLHGSEPPPSTLNRRYAFNLFSHNTPIDDCGYNEEEAKIIFETRKILGMPELKINVTCIRVPVLRAHTEAVTVEFSGEAPCINDVIAVLASSPGLKILDDRAANQFPTPWDATGKDEVFVGRLRRDLSNPKALCMLICGDQLLKGAALNAVQIAEAVLAKSRA